jgi:hypothetical protein
MLQAATARPVSAVAMMAWKKASKHLSPVEQEASLNISK